MRKTLAHGVKMQKNPQTTEKFPDFHGFSWSYVSPKSNLHPRTGNSINDIANPETISTALVQ